MGGEESDEESDDDSDEDVEDCNEENIKVIKLSEHSGNMPPMEFELLSNDVSVVEVHAQAVEVHAQAVAHGVPAQAPAHGETHTSVDEPLNLLNLIPMDEEISSLHSDVNSISAYEHMKVDDLRKVVSDKSLASKEEVKKLKKPELIALLKK